MAEVGTNLCLRLNMSDYDVLHDEPVYSMETSSLNIRDSNVAAAEFNNCSPGRTEAK